MPASSWYAIDPALLPDSPALLLYPERVQRNIDRAIALVGDVQRLRPHVKTNKSAEATRLMLRTGITKFKCATIAEAEMLGQCGAADVLLAYQPVGPKVQRFAALTQQYPGTRYACLCDHPDAARQLAAAFAALGREVSVFLDLNTGQHRSGIAPGETAFQLYTACAGMPGIRPLGLHAYDGHVRQPDLEARRAACHEAFAPVDALRERIRGAGLPEPTVVAGGSPTFPIHAERLDVECSPGTFIYWDQGYSSLCPEQPFEPAALLLTRVVSLPDATKLCLDLGHKSVAAENPLSQRVSFLNAPHLLPIGQSEEHLVVEAGPGHGFQPGDVLYGLPYHICPTVALFERAYTIENGRLSGEWLAVARDRKITC
ncbi:MAG: D-TA family PLP-dependent enzyme [Saprospiraceae bacterium]|nr:D-TA family PLP-dependent enzyme [Saprospiraceae bacterium]